MTNKQLNDKFWLELGGLTTQPNYTEKAQEIFETKQKYKVYYNNQNRRIDNYIKKNNITRADAKTYIISEILTNEHFRNTFAIQEIRQVSDQKRQENCLSDAISELSLPDNYDILFDNNEKRDKFYISKTGAIISEHNVKRKESSFRFNETSKLFDYNVTIFNSDDTYNKNVKNFKNIFVICKHTHGCGGSQDNTLLEIYNTYDFCLQHKSNDCHFLFYLDGDIYQTKRSLKELKETDNISFCTTETLQDKLQYICNDFIDKYKKINQ